MNPQYIKLTAVRITMAQANNRGQPIGAMETKILQPPVVQLVPLPQMFNKGQADGRAERNEGGIAVTHRELFDDVIAAIEKAHRDGDAIAMPIDRAAIAEGAQSATAGIAPLAQQRIRSTGISPTVQEAVETAVNGVKAAIEGEERVMAAIDSVMASEGYVKNGAAVDENDPKWKDFVQTDGENVGAPAYKRRPRVGDLRIHSLQPGKFFLEQAYQMAGALEGETDWAAPNLPFSLLRTFDSRDQLIEEVAKAGRESLLINA